jgi:hypothetical protein
MKMGRRGAPWRNPGYPVPPMTRRPHALAALLAAVLACAAPAAALAQNAGDEQYADPFGKVQNKKKSSSGNQGTQGTSGQGTSGSSQPSVPSDPTAQSSQTTATPAQTLPRTGLPVGLVAAAGAALLGSGAYLRRVADAAR